MPILPKNSTRIEPTGDLLKPGLIVMYEHDGVPLLGQIVEYKKNRYLIFNQRGRDVEIQPERIFSLKTSVPISLSTRESRQDYLDQMMNQGKNEALNISLEEIWTLVHNDTREISCEELCLLYFGSTEVKFLLPLRIALINDRIYFKRHRESFQARNSSTIEELRRAELEKKKKEELRQEALSFFAKKRLQNELQIPDKFSRLIDSIAGVAAERREDDPNVIREVREFLSHVEEHLDLTLSGPPQQRAYTFLREIGYFGKFENLYLIRHDIPINFSITILEQASELTKNLDRNDVLSTQSSNRRDLTHIECITVDDTATRDMDDALSIERTENGYRLGIHISDVASLIAPDSPIDRDAMRRGTSIYLPDRTINMLPEILSQDALSLKANTIRPVLSYFFDIDHRYEILEYRIERSFIKVKSRMNYQEVDELLIQNEYPWDVLHQIAACSEEKRMSNGASKVHKREVLVTLNEDQTLSINEVDEDAPSRSLISELAVLANSASAKYAARNNIPLFFRGQESPDRNNQQYSGKNSDNNAPSGPAQDYQQRFGMKKSLVSIYPSPHSSLGLKEYCQATSPIRRYYDLCNQRQIISYLERGELLYTESDLERILDNTDEHLSRANIASRESRRLWLFYYLIESGMSKRELSGTVVRTDLKSPLIELDDIYLVIGAKSSRKVTLGEHLKLKILSIDPTQDNIRAEVI